LVVEVQAMGVFKAEGLSKAFGTRELFTDVSLEIKRGEKVGLIGPNGAGKTTLLRCLVGLETPDRGRVIVPAGETVGYVRQDTETGTGSLHEELCRAYQDVLVALRRMRELEEAIACRPEDEGLLKEYAAAVEQFERGGGYAYENAIRKVAFGLGFSEADFDRPVSSFSGGQKTRVSLARALLREPDYLFLDEPTNHLDIGMVEWLEEFLRGYRGAVVIVSHDRYFLDRVVERVIEIDGGRVNFYRGNYSTYLKLKTERQAALQAAYDKQEAYIARTQEFINRYRAGVKARQARGRQTRLDRLERLVLPPEVARFNYFAFNPLEESGERVAEVIEATAAYGDRVVFEKLSLLIRRGDGVALVGPNGAGKTTLLKLLSGDLTPRSGQVKLGSRVRVGYFAQEHEKLNPNLRVLDEIMGEFGLSEERARSYLGAFLFSGDDVFKLVGDLSGGEKARLAMLKLMLSGANFLLLDEPTNHLDIPAKEAVEEAILTFPGTFLVVSHDRYFLDKVANRVLELADGKLTEYAGNYSYYREKKAAAAKKAAATVAAAKPAANAAGRKRQRPQDKAKMVQKLEEAIAMLEKELAQLEERLNDPATHTDPALSREVAEAYDRLQAELAARYEEWLALTEDGGS